MFKFKKLFGGKDKNSLKKEEKENQMEPEKKIVKLVDFNGNDVQIHVDYENYNNIYLMLYNFLNELKNYPNISWRICNGGDGLFWSAPVKVYFYYDDEIICVFEHYYKGMWKFSLTSILQKDFYIESVNIDDFNTINSLFNNDKLGISEETIKYLDEIEVGAKYYKYNMYNGNCVREKIKENLTYMIEIYDKIPTIIEKRNKYLCTNVLK